MVRTRVALGSIAGAAMLGAHWLGYLLAAPDGHARDHLLRVTGHGYLPNAALLAIVALVAGLSLFIGGRIQQREGKGSKARLFLHAAPRLIALQTAGFIFLELAERSISGHALTASALLEPVIVVGTLLQVIAAVISGGVLGLLAAAVDRFWPVHITPASRTATVAHLASLVSPEPAAPARSSSPLRGPPLAA